MDSFWEGFTKQANAAAELAGTGAITSIRGRVSKKEYEKKASLGSTIKDFSVKHPAFTGGATLGSLYAGIGAYTASDRYLENDRDFQDDVALAAYRKGGKPGSAIHKEILDEATAKTKFWNPILVGAVGVLQGALMGHHAGAIRHLNKQTRQRNPRTYGYSASPFSDLQKRANAAAELAGLGMLAVPSIQHLRGKPMKENTSHKLELAGLGTLAAPYAWQAGKKILSRGK